MSTRTRQRWSGLLVIGGLLALWQAADVARRSFIKALFVDGAVAGSAPALADRDRPGHRADRRVRVILLDGLSAAHADTLPRLTEICAKGQVLTLDVGFPTVSLPVQHVLWTGLTQQQSGLQYHIGKLATPPAHAIPARVDSVAVAESHPEIVHSFGFTAAPPLPDRGRHPRTPPEPFADSFPSAATRRVAGPARLAFVHVLRIDDAGHKTGGASPEYAAAATWSDELLATLWSARPGRRAAPGGSSSPTTATAPPAATATPSRRSAACAPASSAAPTRAPRAVTRDLHLVDLARALADSLGLALDPAAAVPAVVRRPRRPRRGRHAPDHRPPCAALIAAVLALCGLLALPRTQGRACQQPDRCTRNRAATSSSPRPRPRLALLGRHPHVLHGAPTLSNPVVFPPQGRDMLVAAGPAMARPGPLAALAARRRWSAPRIAARRPGPVVRRHPRRAGPRPRARPGWPRGLPPLTPGLTAWTSVLLAQGRLACLVLAVLLGVVLIVRTLRSPR
jgi:hypothetical protein